MSDYNEIEEFDYCGVLYRATRAQANRITLEVEKTTEWRSYAIATDVVQHSPFSSDGAWKDEWLMWVERRIMARIAMTPVVMRIVEQELAVDA